MSSDRTGDVVSLIRTFSALLLGREGMERSNLWSKGGGGSEEGVRGRVLLDFAIDKSKTEG